MSPEDRARAVVAYFPAIPEKIRPQLEDVVTRAIKRALGQQTGGIGAAGSWKNETGGRPREAGEGTLPLGYSVSR